MQLLAQDHNSFLFAFEAEKGKNYLCPECQTYVRKRSGPHRQPHFFHLQAPIHCRQHQKSEEHLQLQIILHALFADENVSMEAHFPQIQRIADVAWHSKKYIFEIQCSPISLEEAEARERDYRTLGYTLIWILHDRCFNKKRLSAAEYYFRGVSARTAPCYFSDMNAEGKGMIYDQFEILLNHQRIYKGPKLPLQLQTISPNSGFPCDRFLSSMPNAIKQRVKQWSFVSNGDLLDRFCKNNYHTDTLQMHLLETQHAKATLIPRMPLHRINYFKLIKNYYLLCLQWMLDARQ